MKLIGAAFFILISSCTKSGNQSHITLVKVETLAQEVKIPKVIMSTVEAELFKDSKNIVPIYTFAPLSVQMTELSEAVLSQPQLRFDFPKGGGQLDLKNFVKGQGSFYMSFPSDQFADDHELMHVYYVSNSPQRDISGEVYGLGCGRLVDLKNRLNQLQKPDFLKLNTNGLRYLAVTAGRYIFIFRKNNQVFISQLTVTDSRYQSELCLGAEESV